MYEESFEILEKVVKIINEVKVEGRRIILVGMIVIRVLEFFVDENGKLIV